MHKHHFIGLTILVSVLALNPLAATELQNTIQTKTKSSKRITKSIASLLHQRGLDEDAADRIAASFMTGKEELLAQMADRLTSVVSHDEILEHLSNAALHRKDVRLDSYDYLVSMVSGIRQKKLDKSTLAHLNIVAKLNSQLLG